MIYTKHNFFLFTNLKLFQKRIMKKPVFERSHPLNPPSAGDIFMQGCCSKRIRFPLNEKRFILKLYPAKHTINQYLNSQLIKKSYFEAHIENKRQFEFVRAPSFPFFSREVIP